MEAREQLVEALNDLVMINTERAEEYVKAAKELSEDDLDLKMFFRQFASESEQHVTALNEVLSILFAEPNEAHGKAYRIWDKLKYPTVEHDRVAVLNTCDFIEESVEKAYDYVMNEVNLPKEIMGILETQCSSLRNAHEVIKYFNDIRELTPRNAPIVA